MKRNVLFGLLLMSGVFLMNVFAVTPKDSTVYAERVDGKFKFESNWIHSVAAGSYSGTDKVGAPNEVRGMAVKGGKILFPSRASGNSIFIYDGATGVKERTLKLADNVFTYMGRNKADTQDSLRNASLPNNDIQVDAAGNVLVANLITSASDRFQVWKVDLTTGTGTVLVDTDIKTHYPSVPTMRFDAFGVWGDVNGNAVIMAAAAEASAVMEAYQWTIEGGVVTQKPKRIELQNDAKYYFYKPQGATEFEPLPNLGSAPRVLPLNDSFFIIDGNTTYPTLMQISEIQDEVEVDGELVLITRYIGNVVDGFYKVLDGSGAIIDDTAYKLMQDAVTVDGRTFPMNEGHNGIAMFELGGESFVIMAATNTALAPASSFRMFKFKDEGKAFKEMEIMWTFPLKAVTNDVGEVLSYLGMGATSNGIRTAVPRVEVKDNVADIYLYTHENGYAKYTMSYVPTGVKKMEVSHVGIKVIGDLITVSEIVNKIEVYSISGQKIAHAANVSNITVPAAKGVYLVNILDNVGARKIQKVIIQ